MRSIDTAVPNLLRSYRGVTHDLRYDTPTQWTLTVYNESIPASYLKIEVHDVGGIPAALVLERRSVGYRSMSLFMNRLMNALEDPTPSPVSVPPP